MMENRDTLQQLLSIGMQQLTECRTRVRRLDGLKGILLMRRDVACQAAEAHMGMLQSRLSILLHQRLALIERLCEEMEKYINAECRTRVRRLDELNRILFMRREACQEVEAHIRMLQSRLSILLHQRLALIERLCEEKEKCMNAEKDILLQRMDSLTHLCNRSTDYLQFGNEDIWKTIECAKIIMQLRESVVSERCNLNDDAADEFFL